MRTRITTKTLSEAGGLYWKVFTDFQPAFRVNSKSGNSTAERAFSVEASEILRPVIAVLSSDLFWWWYTITTDCRNLSASDIKNFPNTQKTQPTKNRSNALIFLSTMKRTSLTWMRS